MKKIDGKHDISLHDSFIEVHGEFNTAKIFTTNVEESALTQIADLCNMEAYKNSKIRIMPDVHAGAGCTIGTTMEITDAVTPNMVGVDIACGLACVSINHDLPDLFEIDKHIHEKIPTGFMVRENKHARFSDLYLNFMRQYKDYINPELKEVFYSQRTLNSIGTLGGGNHFIEIGVGSESNLSYITVHTGSRGLGKKVADFYQKKAIETCKDKNIRTKALKYLTGDLLQEYLVASKICNFFADMNRTAILEPIVNFIVGGSNIDVLYNTHTTLHNYIGNDNILRKGAISAKEGQLVQIPLNMRDGIIWARGRGNSEWNNSAPHGAGRKFSRATAKELFNLQEFKQSMDGIYSSCIKDSTLDECPMAYKEADDIIKYVAETVDILEIIKPVYNFKG